MTFTKWIDTFIAEKGLDPETAITVQGSMGANHMYLENVIDAIKQTVGREQEQIKATIVKIDFMNGDVMHFFKHLAKALAR